MSYRIAINGFGRIGRDYLRCLLDRGLLGAGFEVVGVNDLCAPATLAHLLAYDSTFGRLAAEVTAEESAIVVAGHRIAASAEPEPERLPWAALGVDLVIESTGRLRSREAAAAHLKAGARRVLVSAPGKGVDATIVLGVNEDAYDPVQHQILSAASCTTNCAAPMVRVLDEAFGIERGYLTTVHAYTNDQMVLDGPHKDLRRARAAAVNIIPTSTGAARAIGLVLPSVAGKLAGVALRVPVENGSIVDLTCQLARPAAAAEINQAFAAAAGDGRLAGVLRYTDRPVVSRDIVGDPASCVFDAALTQSEGGLVKVFGWYDNEWGYSNRLVDLSALLAER
ncbi:type I glyceraldehyde-3-phosphate dehydrogenase [Rhizomonospora bruguierae]|uniref:type I glyceraldehyde-3-phosphate dehydrogenase n=1 Tax=Rhizomonospora bruguierae TaxID=1581705 RepID=UPI001BD117DC|nr:type I glyceraldehyde-3-phosphate dehydrogenase [Micromonospora sp. NBRC 107566]